MCRYNSNRNSHFLTGLAMATKNAISACAHILYICTTLPLISTLTTPSILSERTWASGIFSGNAYDVLLGFPTKQWLAFGLTHTFYDYIFTHVHRSLCSLMWPFTWINYTFVCVFVNIYMYVRSTDWPNYALSKVMLHIVIIYVCMHILTNAPWSVHIVTQAASMQSNVN